MLLASLPFKREVILERLGHKLQFNLCIDCSFLKQRDSENSESNEKMGL